MITSFLSALNSVLFLFTAIAVFFNLLFAPYNQYGADTSLETSITVFVLLPFYVFLSVACFHIFKMTRDYDIYLYNYQRLAEGLKLEKKKYADEDLKKLLKKSSK